MARTLQFNIVKSGKRKRKSEKRSSENFAVKMDFFMKSWSAKNVAAAKNSAPGLRHCRFRKDGSHIRSVNGPLVVIVIVIVISKLLKRYSKATRTRAPAYSRTLPPI